MLRAGTCLALLGRYFPASIISNPFLAQHPARFAGLEPVLNLPGTASGCCVRVARPVSVFGAQYWYRSQTVQITQS